MFVRPPLHRLFALLGASLIPLAALQTARAQEYTPTPTSYKFPYLGIADGWQERLEGVPGRQWLNTSGTSEDAMREMANSGSNAIRITVENQQELTTPSFDNGVDTVDGNSVSLNQRENDYGLDYGGVDLQVDIARRAKANGMKVILTIDMGYQIPASWDSYTYSQMLTAITNETNTLLDPFLNAGIQPDIIISSNESNGGTLGGSSDSLGNRFIGGTSNYTVSTGVYSTLATGDNTIWPKCAGFYKQAILAEQAALTSAGYNPANTRYGLHCDCGAVTWYWDRIFNPNPSEPNAETDYYNSSGVDMGNVTAVPSNLQSIKLRDLVDTVGFSFYPLNTPSGGTQTNFNDDLNNTSEPVVNGGDPNGSQGLNSILTDFATYGFTSNLSSTTGKYTSGTYNGDVAKKVIILEYQASQDDASYDSTNSPTREANYVTYFLNQLANPSYSGFMLGALWWEPEYAQFNNGDGFYLPGPFYTSYDGNPNYDDSPVYQAQPIMTTWGQFAAPSPTLSYSITSSDYGDVIQQGAYTGSYASMQTAPSFGPSTSEAYQVTNNDGYFSLFTIATGLPVSPWNNSTTVGSNVEQTAVLSPPSASQEWTIAPINNEAGTQQIVNHNSGLAMDIPTNGYVLQDTLSTAATEDWNLIQMPRYNLVNAASNLNLDSSPGNIYAGQWTSMQSPTGSLIPLAITVSQQWQVVNDGDGFYRIVNGSVYSDNSNINLLLAPWNNSTTVGGNVEQTTLASPIQTGQEWNIVSLGSGLYHIINRNSGLALDAPSSGSGNAVQNTLSSSITQEWKIVPVY